MLFFFCQVINASIVIAGLTTVIFAQTTDSLSGGAGWIGAGLLGAVLSWLMLKHLPDKDKQVYEFIRRQDEHTIAMASKFAEALREQRIDFKDALRILSDQNDKRTTDIVTALHEELTPNRDRTSR